jgi:hypothetical protein
MDLRIHIRRRLAGFGVNSDAAGELQRISRQDSVAEGQLGIATGEVHALVLRIWRGLGKRPEHHDRPGERQNNECGYDSAIHEQTS